METQTINANPRCMIVTRGFDSELNLETKVLDGDKIIISLLNGRIWSVYEGLIDGKYSFIVPGNNKDEILNYLIDKEHIEASSGAIILNGEHVSLRSYFPIKNDLTSNVDNYRLKKAKLVLAGLM